MLVNLTDNKKEIEVFVKRYLSNAVKNNSYDYTTFGKIVEDLIADSLDSFFSRKYGIKKDQCKRAKDKNDFPDYLLLQKYAIDFKSAIDSQEPENDLGTINSWPDKIKKFGGNNIYFLFVKYSVHNDNTVSICEVYFDNFYKFIGKSKLNTLKYREKDGNLRPKTWKCFSENINEWDTLEEFISAFEITKSTRARRLVEKHFEDMTPNDKDTFINELLKRRKKRISHIHKSTITELFPSNFKIMPQTFDVFELDFALKEYHCLKTTNEFVQRSAYFEEVDGYKTNHYLLCMSKNSKIFEKKSLSTRSFFEANMFSSNYATHGFFPYRGKFHPQMIKAIMNIIGLKKGDTVLDPMCGSGTTNVEAALIGINSIGVDISPFCKLMASVKHQCLYVNLLHLENLINYQKNIVEFYSNSENYLKDIDYFKKQDFAKVVEVEDEQHYYLLRDLLLLIYLDAMGYARRRTNKTIDDVFDDVLKKYILTYADFTKCKKQLNLEIGTSEIYCGTSTSLPIEDNSIDGIITSPPYSFAIDYADNDKPQLEYMGINPDTLKQSMVGLRGNSKKEKIQLYFEDMNKSIAEMSRVLKPGKYCVIIIGSNEIQTGGIRHEVEMKKFAALNGMFLECEIVKPIKGIQNTMKEEFILFFKKGK